MAAEPVPWCESLRELVVLTEESSIEPVVRLMFEAVQSQDSVLKIIPHQGASDLEKSLGRKLRGWNNPQARFLILRDNDRADCRSRKNRLMDIVRSSGKERQARVRIVCQELESWFLADPAAVLAALKISDERRLRRNGRRVPDEIDYPLHELQGISVGYQKVIGARQISRCMSVPRNRSASFAATMSAITELVGDCQ